MDGYKRAAEEAMSGVRRTEKQLRDHRERLSALEDKVGEPRQELESAKKKEENRKKKVETLRQEIEVRHCESDHS